MSLRIVRQGAIALVVLGLVGVWFAAHNTEIPVVQIQDVSAVMNWAYIRVRGTVSRYPSYDEQSARLTFWIDDGTGEIMVAAYRTESRSLIEAGKVPAIGDAVLVEGTLRLKDDFPSLVVNLPDKMSIVRPAPHACRIADIDAADVFQKVQIRGQIRAIKTPYEGLTVLTVRDETAEIDVTHAAGPSALGGQLAPAVVGDSVEVSGAVTLYRGVPQIALDGADSLRVLPLEYQIAAHRQVASVGRNDIGSLVYVEGTIVETRLLSGGTKSTLDDGTGRIAVVLWQNVLDTVADGELREGMRIGVQGVVSEYRGELEMVPELSFDVRLIEAPPSQQGAQPTPTPTSTPLPTSTSTPVLAIPTTTPTPSPSPSRTSTRTPTPVPMPSATLTATPTPGIPELSTGSVSVEHLGWMIHVEGTIVDIVQFSSGIRCVLDDSTGPVILWVPQDLFAQLPNHAAWAVGSVARGTGLVEAYKEEIEVVPQIASGLVIVSAATPAPVKIWRMADLGLEHIGQRVTVKGTIAEVEPFSKGTMYVLDDGSAEITLLLWQNILDTVPDAENLVPGAVVQASGKVQEYQGKLEIVPGIGTDVVLW